MVGLATGAAALDRMAQLARGNNEAPVYEDRTDDATLARVLVWHFAAICSPVGNGEAQTLLCGWATGPTLASLWIGLQGREHRLGVLLSPAPGRSPHLWLGPVLPPDKPFEIQIAVHTGMGPGGLLCRWDDESPWSSLTGASPWGAERFIWPAHWSLGHDQRGSDSRAFRGHDLQVRWYTKALQL